MKIKADAALFTKWREFEKKYGFDPNFFSSLVQNDIEITEQAFKKKLEDYSIIVMGYYQQIMMTDFNELISLTRHHAFNPSSPLPRPCTFCGNLPSIHEFTGDIICDTCMFEGIRPEVWNKRHYLL